MVYKVPILCSVAQTMVNKSYMGYIIMLYAWFVSQFFGKIIVVPTSDLTCSVIISHVSGRGNKSGPVFLCVRLSTLSCLNHLMNLDSILDKFDGQCHRAKVMVTRLWNMIFYALFLERFDTGGRALFYNLIYVLRMDNRVMTYLTSASVSGFWWKWRWRPLLARWPWPWRPWPRWPWSRWPWTWTSRT